MKIQAIISLHAYINFKAHPFFLGGSSHSRYPPKYYDFLPHLRKSAIVTQLLNIIRRWDYFLKVYKISHNMRQTSFLLESLNMGSVKKTIPKKKLYK